MSTATTRPLIDPATFADLCAGSGQAPVSLLGQLACPVCRTPVRTVKTVTAGVLTLGHRVR